MSITIEASEIDEFRTAVAGLVIDWVRTDRGAGPCKTSLVHGSDASFSSGTMGFSAISQTEVPDNSVTFTMITSSPPGLVWCGVELSVGELNVYPPGTPFFGTNPTGLGASFLVVERDLIDDVAAAMRVTPVLPRSVDPLPMQPAAARLQRAFWQFSAQPDLLDDTVVMSRLVETAVLALAGARSQVDRPERRLDSRKIVLDCLDYAEAAGSRIPSMRELCRASCASESRVRHAFVEILDASPTQYFQYRLLSQLRDDLLQADPTRETVTRIASSLGVTQLGRIAGRYRSLFDELPSDTLRRGAKGGRIPPSAEKSERI